MASTGTGPYAVSKASLHFLMMLYGAELTGEGILFASVHPGLMDTEMASKVLQMECNHALETYAEAGIWLISVRESVEGIIKVVERMRTFLWGSFSTFNNWRWKWITLGLAKELRVDTLANIS